jgi:hypothetical protein
VSTQLLRMSASFVEAADRPDVGGGDGGEAAAARAGADEDEQPKDWDTAYDMRPWPDFPDRTLP